MATYNTINNDVTMSGDEGTLLAGRYRIVRQLGAGGMGSVWLVEDTQLDGKLFAVKMLPSVLVSNARAYRQLKSEALVAMKLVHPNIVQIRAFEENDGNPFLVMDYIEGQTLDNCLEGWGNLSAEEAAALLKPIAEALDYAHSQGVVHRDVKPGNVMVRSDGVPFILDFGIAREVQESMTHITGRQSSGTLLYMSPEQLNGDAPRPAQDVYSFAAMAYECIKGAPPFSRGNVEYQIMNKVPEPLSEGGDAPTPLVAGIMAGLSKTPEKRPESCMALLSGGGLTRRQVVGVSPPSPSAIVSPAPDGGKSQKRWWSDIPKTPVAVILTVLVMLGAFVCKQHIGGKKAARAPSARVDSGDRGGDSKRPSPADAVTTNRVVRIVTEETVRSNRVVHVVDNVVVTNYVVETRHAGEKPQAAKGPEAPWVPGPTEGLVLSEDGKTFLSAPKGVKSVAIPDGVTKIADGALAGQKELMFVSIPSTVTEIGQAVFSGCDRLSGIFISDIAAWCKIPFPLGDTPSEQPLRGRSLFLNGRLVEDLVIPQGVTSIGESAFRGCASITRVEIPDSVVSINPTAFAVCRNHAEIVVAENNQHYKSVGGLLLTKDGMVLVSVPSARGCIVIPNGVAEVGTRAFFACGLEKLTIPSSVAKIGWDAFAGCRNLKEVHVSDIAAWCRHSSPEIGAPLAQGSRLFLNGMPVAELEIPEGVTSIGKFAFKGYSGLTHVTIPQSVNNIEGNAFSFCHNMVKFDVAAGNRFFKSENGLLLTKDGKILLSVPSGREEVRIPQGVESIAGSAFAGCSKIVEVKVPKGVKSIGWHSFDGCKNLAKIELPEGLECLGRFDRAFCNCIMLDNVTIPGSVKEIGANAFFSCRQLKNVTIQNGAPKVIQSGAFAETGIAKIVIPESVTKVADGAFRNCKSLQSVTIPEGLTDIAENAFEGCVKLLDVNGKPRLTRVPRGANKSTPAGSSNPAPTVKIVATVDGREVKGAKVRVGAKDHLAPVTWNVKNGASYGPYDVSYENGGRRYRGRLGKITVDWRGEKTFTIPLVLRGSSK